MADQDVNFEMNINAVDQREMFDKSKIIARPARPSLFVFAGYCRMPDGLHCHLEPCKCTRCRLAAMA